MESKSEGQDDEGVNVAQDAESNGLSARSGSKRKVIGLLEENIHDRDSCKDDLARIRPRTGF